MPHIIPMAAVVAGAEEAAIASWSVSVGDRISVGDTIAEVETEKALVDLVSDTAGTLVHLTVAAGDSVAVGAPVAVVGLDGDSAAAIEAAIRAADAMSVSPSMPDDVDPPAPVPAKSNPEPGVKRIVISPLARRIARENSLDPRTVRGSGPGGRIMRADIEAAIRGTAESVGKAAESHLTPLSRMRATIARRLTEAKASVPHFYIQGRVNAGRLIALRQEINALGRDRVSVNDLIVKAVAVALQRVPEMNASYTADGLRMFRDSDVGVAVALADGIVVPVIRRAQALSVTDLAAESASLAVRAREGGLREADLHGGSITVSNLGMFGVENFSAIINPPQAAILAVGAARADAVVEEGAVVVGTVMAFTLSVDHRAVDGAVAARWVSEFSTLLENPIAIVS